MMGTRALYTFALGDEVHNVYSHWDNYPTEASKKLQRAMRGAWETPRFEPDEFGAAFIAANKSAPGDVRLVASAKDWRKVAPSDIEYRYDVRQAPNGQLLVYAYRVCETSRWDSKRQNWKEALIWKGRIKDFPAVAEKVQEESSECKLMPAKIWKPETAAA